MASLLPWYSDHLSIPSITTLSISYNYQSVYGFASTDSLLIIVHSPLCPIIHLTSAFWHLIPKYPQSQWSLPPLHNWQLFLCIQHLLALRNKWLLEVNYRSHLLPIAYLVWSSSHFFSATIFINWSVNHYSSLATYWHCTKHWRNSIKQEHLCSDRPTNPIFNRLYHWYWALTTISFMTPF